jgi:uncharacterized membrane protein YdjX (TVP38/TMEM64 family)
MSATATDHPHVAVRAPRWFARRRFVLIMSLFVIPIALSASLNSYAPLTVDSALRMAFASVAGQTIAIIGALVALVITLTSRRSLPGVIFFALVALLVTVNAVSAMSGTGQLLLDRLDLIAETAALD